MKFVDEATIRVLAGNGGHGCLSFRREKYVERGGPDGGDGGHGGSVFLVADASLNTLADFRVARKFKAAGGDGGSGRNKTGRSGDDLDVMVPLGTVVHDVDTGELICDLTEPGQRQKVAEGGRGGLGNTRFKSSVNRAPRKITKGTPGEARHLRLELKVLADVGLLGMPNAGKSTLITAMSSAKPRIADYPFTTLHPNLGVVRVGQLQSFVMADIPGLIEGASEGAGLGIQFLKLDGRLIQNLTNSTVSQTIVQALFQVAKALDTRIIAKSVQDAESLALLWNYGADYVQGHYFQAPSEQMDYVFAGESIDSDQAVAGWAKT